MPQTLLPKKAGFENPIATDDDHHDLLAADPTVNQFSQNSSFGPANTTNTFAQPSAFGTPTAGGFSGGFDNAPATTAGSTTMPTPQQNLTAAGSNAAQGADVLIENTNTDWINKKWRPMMGWMYMVVCTCDFVLFPVLWSLLQTLSKGQVTMQYQPLTLQGAGLFHISMGAVLGIAAYGRTKEKIEGAAK